MGAISSPHLVSLAAGFLVSRPRPFQVGRRGVLGIAQSQAAFCEDARDTPVIAAIIVDGSFVTSKAEPNDIDLLVVLPADHPYDAHLRPFEYNLLSRRRVRRLFGFDIVVARAESAEYQKLIAFFAQVRGVPDITKGLLRVKP